MSTVYNLEPQPTAKVVLHTTAGDLLIEVFAQQTPLTSRNFLQHCLDSYYDNTIFHRLVPGFIIQGGDPTGTGHGGESSYDGGAAFADEFHSRLKFNRRGLLGMANTGEKDDNGSQFFFTLGKTEELTGRNTMFGRISDNTIFNLVKMGEAELTEDEGSERPMYPTRITGTEVLVNPFEDMERRVKQAPQQVEDKQPKKKQQKKKAGKALLSFGNDEGEDLVAPVAKAKYNPKLINAESPVSSATNVAAVKRPAPEASNTERPVKRRVSPPLSPSRQALPKQPPPKPATKLPNPQTISSSDSSSDSDSEREADPKKKDLLSATNDQIEALKSSLKRDVPTAVSDQKHRMTALEAMMPAGSIRGRKKPKQSSGTNLSRDEQRTLDSFNAFKKRLEGASTSSTSTHKQQREAKTKPLNPDNPDATNGARSPPQAQDTNSNAKDTGTTNNGDEEAVLCDLHFIANCQSCSKWDVAEGEGGAKDADSDNDDIGWMGRQLTFAKDRLGKDLEWKRQNEQELVVIDPKEKAREIRDEARKGKGRDRDGTRDRRKGKEKA